jgi:tetratricopeptide (TPR) repeat protein
LLGENHSRVTHMQRYLKKIQDELADFEEDHTEWIKDLQSINREDLHQCSRLYHEISVFYSHHELFNESVKYLLLELETCQNIDGYEPEEIIHIFFGIAECYRRMFNYSEAFVYMLKAFQLSQSIEQINPKIVRNTQTKIDNFVHRAATYNIKLPWIPLSQVHEDILW